MPRLLCSGIQPTDTHLALLISNPLLKPAVNADTVTAPQVHTCGHILPAVGLRMMGRTHTCLLHASCSAQGGVGACLTVHSADDCCCSCNAQLTVTALSLLGLDYTQLQGAKAQGVTPLPGLEFLLPEVPVKGTGAARSHAPYPPLLDALRVSAGPAVLLL